MGVATYILKKYSNNTDTDADRPYISLEDIAYLLTQMPHGTTICSINPEPIVDLSLRFKIKLHNSIFKDNTELKDTADYFRDMGFTEHGVLREFNRSFNFNFDEVIRRESEPEELEEEEE